MGRKPWRIDKISTYFLSAGGGWGIGNWEVVNWGHECSKFTCEQFVSMIDFAEKVLRRSQQVASMQIPGAMTTPDTVYSSRNKHSRATFFQSPNFPISQPPRAPKVCRDFITMQKILPHVTSSLMPQFPNFPISQQPRAIQSC